MTYVYLALLGRRCFLKCCTFYFMHLLGSRSLDWSWRRRKSARCQRQPLFCLPLGRVRGQFEGRWTDSFSRGSRGFGDCRKSARTLETRWNAIFLLTHLCCNGALLHLASRNTLLWPSMSESLSGTWPCFNWSRWMATTASTAPLSWSSKVKTEDSRFNPCAPIWNSAWILQEKPCWARCAGQTYFETGSWGDEADSKGC